jgi:hypothetical protein
MWPATVPHLLAEGGFRPALLLYELISDILDLARTNHPRSE